MTALTRQLLEQKRQRRRLLAQLTYPEKVRIVEKLRDASRRLAQAAQRQGLRADSSAELAGCLEGPRDIATNPKYLEGFGE
jgi:hypothetical protein